MLRGRLSLARSWLPSVWGCSGRSFLDSPAGWPLASWYIQRTHRERRIDGDRGCGAGGGGAASTGAGAWSQRLGKRVLRNDRRARRHCHRVSRPHAVKLIKEFQDSGHRKIAQSWIGAGPNQEIAPNDLAAALGSDTIDRLTKQTGMARSDLLAGLSQNLPHLIDQLTPDGRLPTADEASRMV
jgi:uncharacterized protein YidB (DUF937 family)